MSKKIWKGKEFICEVCNTKFLSRHINVRFCSNSCRATVITNFLKNGEPVNKKEGKIRNCLTCGKKLHSQTKTGLCKEHYVTKEYKENKRKIALENNFGGYRKGSGRGKSGRYKGIWCDSSWELAWVIYHLENNIPFKRNWEKFDYTFGGKNLKYIPDFKTNEYFVEVKGYMTEKTTAKLNQFTLPIKMYYEEEMKPILEYVTKKYGKDFIKLYEHQD